VLALVPLLPVADVTVGFAPDAVRILVGEGDVDDPSVLTLAAAWWAAGDGLTAA